MKNLQKNVKRYLSAVLVAALVVTMLPVSYGAGKAEAAAGSGDIIVNPDTHYQTLEGWGTSLCWWGNTIGSWGEADFNDNSRPDREEIAELAFSPDYLNMNIVRYNVGGGDAPGHWKQGESGYHMKRVEGRVPGWTTDMGFSEDGTGAYNETAFLGKNLKDMNDAGQLWMLSQANSYRQDKGDIINEVFSNSPPYYMTESGCSSGNTNASSDNLKAEKVDDFAAYMARAALWINNYLGETYQTSVSYIEPMNEPDTSYWSAGSTKQEGCHFDTGTSQSNMIAAMQGALDNDQRLSGITIQSTDETSLDKAINSYNKLSPAAKDATSVIGAHTYGGSNTNRNDLRDLAASHDKGLWMSEITKGGGAHNHNSMVETQTASLSGGIMSDLKLMEPTAWVAWLLADSEYECLKFNENWGPIHCVFEKDGQPEASYHTNLVNPDGTRKDGVPGEGQWYLTKQFYTLMQYTKYLKAGYTMVEIGDDNMLAAVSPDRKELVIVAQNNSEQKRQANINLTRFGNADQIQLYRTSDEETGTVQNSTTGDTTECCTKIDGVSLQDGSFTSELPAHSISTFVITNSGASALYTEEGYAEVINDRVVYQGNEAGQSKDEVNKFQYTGSWSKESANSGYGSNVTTTGEAGAKAVFTFQGDRAVLLGQKLENGAAASVSVDGGEAVEISTAADSKLDEAVLFDTGKLTTGKHKIEVTVKQGEAVKFAIDSAKIMHGEVELFQAPSVSVSGHPNALKVKFAAVAGAESYHVYYGTNAENLTKIENAASPTVIKGLENNTEYVVQVEAVNGEKTVKTKLFRQTPEIENEKVLYYVDAGAAGFEMPTDGEVMGVYNSTMDQKFGEDLVSGKKWGYVESTSGGEAYDTATYGRWMSVRHNNSKTNGSGIHYQFELAEGTYTVTVGCMDPWGNANRKQIINIQGVDKGEAFAPKKVENRASYVAEVKAEDNNTLDVGVNLVGTNDNSLVSWIKVEKYDADKIAAVLPVNTATTDGVAPQLPAAVDVTTMGGGTATAAVTWKTEGVSFTGNPYSSIKVKGTVEGTDIQAAATVQIVPKEVEYFVDCSNTESPTLANVKQIDGTTLQNQDSADQMKTGENNWGRISVKGTDVNAFEGSAQDPYTNGWYAGGGKNITYQFTLPAGAHEIAMGCTGWWSMNRDMDVYCSYEGSEEVKLFDLDAKSNTPVYAGKKMVLAEEKLVTLTVKKAGDSDPILSWISISKTESQEAALKELNITPPNKSVYKFGEAFDSTGLKVTAVYTDDTSSDVTAQAEISGFDSCKPGEQNVKVTFGVLAKSFKLTIEENESEITDNSWLIDSEILYAVNCGATEATNTWQVYPGESKGSRQSVSDQAYGADGTYSWGYTSKAPDSPLSYYEKSTAKESFWYMANGMQYDAAKSGIKYDFAVDAGKKYLVTVGFYNPWGDKKEDVVLEGRILGSALSVSKTREVEKTYVVTSDDVLNLKVKTSGTRKSGDDDPILNYIIVREMPVYTLDVLQGKLDELKTSIEGKTYSEASLAAWSEAVTEAEELIRVGTADSDQVMKAYQEIVRTHKALKEIVVFESIMGTDCDRVRLTDNNGETIQAHGGQIQKWGDTWYWYGEDKSGGLAPVGVHLYTSQDLYNWTDEGIALRTMESKEQFTTDSYFSSLYGNLTEEQQELVYRDIDKNTAVVERPKVIYNKTTGKYIMWFHADGPYNGGDPHSYWKAMAGVAVADAPQGPFRFISAQRLHTSEDYNGAEKDFGMARDMNLFVDEGADVNNDGVDDAYIIYSSENNATMYISRLNADYTKLDKAQGEAVENVDFSRNFAGASREAPAMFHYNGKYYLMTSGCTGWAPNAAKYAVADTPLGPWTDMGDPCIGDGSATTFGTQSTCVIPVDAQNGKFIYMGDRWYNPDHGKDVGDSRYVWLPVEFGNNYGMTLRDTANWTIEELGKKPGFEIANIEVLPKAATDLDIYMEELPATMLLQMGGNGQAQEIAVTWSSQKDISGLNAVITGSFQLEGETNTFTHKVYICPQDMMYFIDCGTDEFSGHSGSDYVSAAQETGNILNDVSDQKYDEAKGWGYTSVTDKENGSNYDVGYHSGSNIWENGWWAGSGKSITYRVKLPAGNYQVQSGYQEWWSATRNMKFQAGIVKEDDTIETLDTQSVTISSSAKDAVQTLSFGLKEEATVQISVNKENGGDPVLSFLAIYYQEPVLTGISVTPPTATDYKVGDEILDTTGMIVTALYDCGLETDVTSLAQTSGFDTATVGEKTITVSYEGMEATFTIQVLVNRTALQKLYDDNKDTEKGIYTDESFDAFQTALSKAQEVIAKDTTQEEIEQTKTQLLDAINGLTVKEGILLESLELTTPPARTEYVVKGTDEIDLTGMKVTAIYDDGSRLTVTSRVTIGALDRQSLGEKAVAVTFQDKTTEFMVTIIPADKTKLQQFYDANKDKAQGNYTNSSYGAYQTALQQVKAVLEDEQAGPAELDAAKQALADAIAGLAQIQSLNGAVVKLNQTIYTYDGTEKKPKETVSLNGQTLTANDYTISYRGNVNAGTAVVTITGKGDYKDSRQATFTIGKASFAAASVKLGTTSYTYDGKAKNPGTTVVLAGKTLRLGTDYTVRYNNNVNAGTAVVTMIPTASLSSNYNGTRTSTFTIKKASKKITVKSTSIKKTYGNGAFTLGAATKKGEALSYSLSNKSVIKISGGKAKIIGCGTVSVTISSKASKNYNAASSKKITVTVKPKKASISAISSIVAGQMQVEWKQDTKASGYEIVYAASSKFKSAKKITIKSNKTVSKTISKLSKKKTYYVKIRSYTTVGGKKIYGDYSSVKKVKITSVTIKPKKISISKVLSKKAGQMTISWKKDTKVSGYEITYSTSSKFTSAKKAAVKSYKSTSKTISKLSKGKTYYVKMRSYKTVKGKKIYSDYSSVKKLKVRK